MAVVGYHGEYRSTAPYRAHQNETSIAHIAQQAEELLKMLNALPTHTMNMGSLMDRGSALVRSKKRLESANGVGYGDLFDVDVKAELIAAHPLDYPDVSAINAKYAQFQTYLIAAIGAARAVYDAEIQVRGGTISLDADGEQFDPPITANVDALRVALTNLRAFIRKTPAE